MSYDQRLSTVATWLSLICRNMYTHVERQGQMIDTENVGITTTNMV